MINSQDIKKGTCIRLDGKLYFCVDFLHVKPGKGNTIMRTTLKDVVKGGQIERRFNIGEKLEDVRVERRPYQFLYKEGDTIMRTTLKDVVKGGQIERRFNIGEKLEDVRVERRPYQYTYQEGEHYHFMNQETFDDIIIDKNLINGVDFMIEGQIVEVVSDASTETVLFADMPVKVQLKVTYTEPGIKGDTATNTLKPATVESGAEVRVPLFIEEGEIIEINTQDGSYVGRIR